MGIEVVGFYIVAIAFAYLWFMAAPLWMILLSLLIALAKKDK
jgi:hypothetical protein